MSRMRPKMICKACGDINTSLLSRYSLRCHKCGGELMLGENAWFGTKDTELLRITHFGQCSLGILLFIGASIISDTVSFIILSVVSAAVFYAVIFTLAKIREKRGFNTHSGPTKIHLSHGKHRIKRGEPKWVEEKMDTSKLTFLMLGMAIIVYEISQIVDGYQSEGTNFFLSADGVALYSYMIILGAFVFLVGIVYIIFSASPIKIYDSGIELPTSYYGKRLKKQEHFIPFEKISEISPIYRSQMITNTISIAGISLVTTDGKKNKLLYSRNYPLFVSFEGQSNSEPFILALKGILGKRWDALYKERPLLSREDMTEIEKYVGTSPIIRMLSMAILFFGMATFIMLASLFLIPLGLSILLVGSLYILKYEDRYTLAMGNYLVFAELSQEGFNAANKDVMR